MIELKKCPFCDGEPVDDVVVTLEEELKIAEREALNLNIDGSYSSFAKGYATAITNAIEIVKEHFNYGKSSKTNADDEKEGLQQH